MSDKYDRKASPEARRAWVEARAGLSARNEIREELCEQIRPLMKKKDVIDIAASILDKEWVEEGHVVRCGNYYFVFDDFDRLLIGPNFALDGGITIGETR